MLYQKKKRLSLAETKSYPTNEIFSFPPRRSRSKKRVYVVLKAATKNPPLKRSSPYRLFTKRNLFFIKKKRSFHIIRANLKSQPFTNGIEQLKTHSETDFVTDPFALKQTLEFFKPYFCVFFQKKKKRARILVIILKRRSVRSIVTVSKIILILWRTFGKIIGCTILINAVGYVILVVAFDHKPFQAPVPNFNTQGVVCNQEGKINQTMRITGSPFIETTCSIPEFFCRYGRLPLPHEHLTDEEFFNSFGYPKIEVYPHCEGVVLKLNGHPIFNRTHESLLRNKVDQQLLKKARFLKSNVVENLILAPIATKTSVVPGNAALTLSKLEGLNMRLINIHSLGITRPAKLLDNNLTEASVSKARDLNSHALQLFCALREETQTLISKVEFTVAKHSAPSIEKIIQMEAQQIDTGIKLQMTQEILKFDGFPVKHCLFTKWGFKTNSVGFKTPAKLEVGLSTNKPSYAFSVKGKTVYGTALCIETGFEAKKSLSSKYLTDLLFAAEVPIFNPGSNQLYWFKEMSVLGQAKFLNQLEVNIILSQTPSLEVRWDFSNFFNRNQQTSQQSFPAQQPTHVTNSTTPSKPNCLDMLQDFYFIYQTSDWQSAASYLKQQLINDSTSENVVFCSSDLARITKNDVLKIKTLNEKRTVLKKALPLATITGSTGPSRTLKY